MPVSMWTAAASRAPARAAVGRPVAHLGQARQHGAQIEAGVVRLGARQQAVEHVDGGARLHLARGAALVDGGDEEGLAALAGERLGDRREPQAVGVGLDDAGAFGAARGLVEARPVGAQRGEVDGENGARGQRDRALRGRAAASAAVSLSVTRCRSGMYWSRARSEKRVTLPSNCSCDGADGPVALLADDHLGLAADELHLGHPVLELGRALLGLRRAQDNTPRGTRT